MFFQNVNLNEMVMCLEDLINYFAQPEDDMGKVALLIARAIVCRCNWLTMGTMIFTQSTKRSRTDSER